MSLMLRVRNLYFKGIDTWCGKFWELTWNSSAGKGPSTSGIHEPHSSIDVPVGRSDVWISPFWIRVRLSGVTANPGIRELRMIGYPRISRIPVKNRCGGDGRDVDQDFVKLGIVRRWIWRVEGAELGCNRRGRTDIFRRWRRWGWGSSEHTRLKWFVADYWKGVKWKLCTGGIWFA